MEQCIGENCDQKAIKKRCINCRLYYKRQHYAKSKAKKTLLKTEQNSQQYCKQCASKEYKIEYCDQCKKKYDRNRKAKSRWKQKQKQSK